ncbi:helix-turn-helix domain-containing protein [Ostreiculturibacter nitratireducens]|uniref:helix-turn-helix domain-containing protein n=1 Tax=Ostreiculturibacter nitratireducens TaxID=3075226 RepID=UPI0031B5DD43
MPTRQTEEGEFIGENFGAIWPVHLAAFTRFLTQLRKRFDGDLDLMLVLAVIGERTQPESWAPGLLTYRQLTRGRDEERLQYPINVQSVADYSGIPRETVRRKIALLQRKGWITRDDDGCLSVSRAAATELEDATGDSIAYLAALLIAFDTARGRRDDGRSK